MTHHYLTNHQYFIQWVIHNGHYNHKLEKHVVNVLKLSNCRIHIIEEVIVTIVKIVIQEIMMIC